MANVLILAFESADPADQLISMKQHLQRKGAVVTLIFIDHEARELREPDATIFERVYLAGHGNSGGDFISTVSILGATLWLRSLGRYRSGTVFTLICCCAAEPVLPSQKPGEDLPAVLPIAVKLLFALTHLGVLRPVVHAYAGLIAIMMPALWQLFQPAHGDSVPAIGQRYSLLDTRSMSAALSRADYATRIAPHVFRHPDVKQKLNPAIRPRHLPGTKFAYSYNSEGLLEVLELPAC